MNELQQPQKRLTPEVTPDLFFFNLCEAKV
jgi:hypothetical protein